MRWSDERHPEPDDGAAQEHRLHPHDRRPSHAEAGQTPAVPPAPLTGETDAVRPTPPPEPWLDPGGLGGQLHPAVIGVWSAGQFGALIIVAVINPVSLVVLLPIAAVLAAINAVRWARFRWQVTDGTLVIAQGLVSRHRRVIPLERIQSVDVVRRISHRLFRVEALHVEAIGGGDTEGQLTALAPPVARRVRAALLAGRDAARAGEDPQAHVAAVAASGATGDDQPAATGDRAPTDDEEQLARVRPRQLVQAGLTEANVTVLAAAAGFGWQLLSERVEEIARRLPALIGPGVAVLVIVGLLLTAVLLLILGQLLTYWNFRLSRTERELRVRRGLLEQRFDTIPLRRVQALRIEENVPRRLLGFAAVKADVAGKPGGGSTGTDTLLPFGTTAQARELVATILNDPRAPHVELRPMPRRARNRRRVRALLVAALVVAAALLLWGPLGLLAALVVLPALAAADAAYRALGWAHPAGLLVSRAGWWTRRTAFVPEHRVQALTQTATVLQRWRRLGTVELRIARSPGLWSGPRWIDMDATDADRQMLGLARIMHGAPERGAPEPQPAAAGPSNHPGSRLLP